MARWQQQGCTAVKSTTRSGAHRQQFRAVAGRRLDALSRAAAIAVALLATGTARQGAAQTISVDPQRDGGSTSSTRREITSDDIAILLRQVSDSKTLDEETRKSLIKQYEQAQLFVKQADEESARLLRFQRDASEAPSTQRRLRAELDGPHRGTAISAQATVAELEKLVSEAKTGAADAQKNADRLKEEPSRRQTRKQRIAKLEATAKERLEQIGKEFPATLPNESKEKQQARRTVLRAERLSIERRSAALEAELRYYESTGDLLTTEQLWAVREANRRKDDLERLVRATEERRRHETELQQQEARRDRNTVHPALRPVAEQNEALASERADFAKLIAETVANEKQLIGLRDKVKEDYKTAAERVRRAGLTDSTGQFLLRQKERLPDPRAHQRSIRKRRADIARINLMTFEHDQRRLELANLSSAVEKRLAELPDTFVPEEQLEIETEMRRLLETQIEYLGELLREGNKCFDLLMSAEAVEQELISESERFAAYVAENILWVRSADPIGRRHLSRTIAAAEWLADPSSWSEILTQLAQDGLRPPFTTVFGLVVIAAGFVISRRMRGELVAIGKKASKPYASELRPTLRAVVVTVAISLTGPGLVWFFAWRLGSFWPRGDLLGAVAQGLETTAYVYFAVELFRQICRPCGLGEAHFQWGANSLGQLRRWLRGSMAIGLPIVFLVSVFNDQPSELHRDSLGRCGFLAGMLVLAVFAYGVLRPKGSVVSDMLARQTGGWVERIHVIWFPLAVSAPVLLAVIDALGYCYTAQRLALRLQFSIVLVMSLIIANALVLRWLLLAKRRLAIHRARERREAAQQESSRSAEGAAAEAPSVSFEMPAITLSDIDTQNHKLLQSVVVVALCAGIWLIWVDVLPALSRVGDIELWSTTAKIVQSVPGAESATALVETVRPVRLTEVAVTVAIGLMTIIASKNIPGLLEITVLQRLPIDAAGRYAISTLCRYGISIVGLLVGCGTLGIGWSSVQWLAAAMTVGLGFGLQEIFANFVSGLILLFERPIRVGDIVTVGDTTGVVSRLRIRATTVTDWDRKELIIPNKEFITGKVLNWTLSDSINRVVIPVGVAYGTDTAHVQRLLLQVAEDHPLVLNDPPPLATLEGFGENALTFVLRCFLANFENRGAVVHELHAAIDKAFRRAGIEIPFTRRDIHVHSHLANASQERPPLSAGASWRSA